MIKAWMIGNEQVIRKLAAMPDRIGNRIFGTVYKWSLNIESAVKGSKLSGQVLNVRTGTLRRSIAHKIFTDSTSITGQIGTNVKYAAFHEYGFHRNESVRAHLRTIKKAWGRPLASGPKQIAVKAHMRKINYPARSFLRSVLELHRVDIQRDLIKATREAVKS